MESRRNRSPRPPLDQVFNRVGSFEELEDGSLLATLTSEPVQPVPDPKDFQGGSPVAQ